MGCPRQRALIVNDVESHWEVLPSVPALWLAGRLWPLSSLA